MRTLVAAFAAAVALFAVAAAPAHAQIAAALGRPLPSKDLAAGTISVRVVAGGPQQSAIGVEVTLTIDGATRAARTDSEGRAIFTGVPAGATVVASVPGDEGPVKSQAFPVPAEGGVRLLMSTKPFGPGAEDTGVPGPGGGMAQREDTPRSKSGQAVAVPDAPPGEIAVQLSYDSPFGAMPSGHPVYLVSYGADGSIASTAMRSEGNGRAVFKGLDRTGGTSYFAMTLLPRGSAVDRLVSEPMTLDGTGGRLVVLSAAKKDSTEPALDDYKGYTDQYPVPAGTVVAQLDFAPAPDAAVRLVDAATGKTVAETTPRAPSAVPGSLTASLDPVTVDAAAAAGTLTLQVSRSTEQRGLVPAVEGTVLVRAPGAPAGVSASVASGKAVLQGVPQGVALELVFSVGDQQSKPVAVTVPAGKAGASSLTVTWASRGGLEARFTGVAGETPYYLETTVRGNVSRSYPFQIAPDRGCVVSIAVLPRRVFMTFGLRGSQEDAYFAVQGRFRIEVVSWAPYRASPDGMLLPLPEGFTGAVAFDTPPEMTRGQRFLQKDDVSIDPKGFRILRPLPPGSTSFHGGFSFKPDGGAVGWKMPLPLGAFDSSLEIADTPGLQIDVPAGATIERKAAMSGEPFQVISDISIQPEQTMVMTIRGLPMAPAWTIWGPRLVGLAVVVMLGVGLAMAMRSRRAPASGAEVPGASRARIDALYEELVVIDKSGGDGAKRAAVLAELETLLAERSAARRADAGD